MANGINTYLDEELAGLKVYGDYVTGTDAGVQIDKLLALVEPEYTQTERGYLDMMAHPAQLQLIKELRALKTAIGAYTGV